MIFRQHYSSSSGNLYEVIATNGSRLLLEAGVRWSLLQKALNYNFKGIESVFVSHNHKDHSKALPDILKAGIDVYSGIETFTKHQLDHSHRVKVIKDKDLIRLKDFDVLCFATNHDCDGSLGFVVREKATKEYILFATDTSHITQRFKLKLNIIAIECSYNKEYLAKRVEEGTINESLAKRLLTSHMEEKEAMRYLSEFCDLSRCREIHLLHCSADNINKDRIKAEFERKFFIETKIVGMEAKNDFQGTNSK